MKLEQLFGIELPIIQAPMAGVQGSALAIAVSNAGGLGSLPCATLSTDAMQQELNLLRSQTSKPYNVNFFCHTPPTPSIERETAWRKLLAPYYERLGLDQSQITAGAARGPFNPEAADVLEEFRPAVVSFHFGLPAVDLLARVKSWGSKILCSATTVAEARYLEEKGVDAIIAQGVEAGGHRGMFLTNDLTTQIDTFALVPQILAAVRAPVIAAGGIADARGVAAALKLGAAGVQLGTSNIHRAALKSEAARHTALTNLFTGRPARSIVNLFMRELGPINALAPEFPLAATALGPLRTYSESHGTGDFSPLWSGQNVSGCREIPAAELTQHLMSELSFGA